jgi:enoyl-CoA hydratase/carnithine racemase
MTGTDRGFGKDVLSETRDRVAIITLNRPEARNALSMNLLAELDAALHAAEHDDEVGAILLTGTDPAFWSGADLKEMAASMDGGDFWQTHERTSRSMRIHALLRRIAKPVVAAVNGPALAGGCGLAMSCDLVISSDKAVFGYPEVARGLVAALVMVSLSRLVSHRDAMDLLLTGRKVLPAEARELRMINRVVPHESLMDEALAYAAGIAAHPLSALRMTKDLFRQVGEMDYDLALEHARDVNLMMRQTRDAKAGATAFSQRKTAQ